MEEKVKFLIHYNGSWKEEYEFCGYTIHGVVVPSDASFPEFKQKVYRILKLDESDIDLKFQYQLMPNYQPVDVLDDESVYFYLLLRADCHEIMTCPLCTQSTSRDRNLQDSNLIAFLVRMP